MHRAAAGRAGGGEPRAASCWKFANLAAISRPHEYDTAAGHRARSARYTPRCNPRVPFGRQPPLLLPPSRGPPRRAAVRDPRLTRARPLFSTRWSFVDAFLFVIPFVIPLPLFVAHRRALLTLSLSDRESRPIKPAGGRRSFNARGKVEMTPETIDAARNMRAFTSDPACVSPAGNGRCNSKECHGGNENHRTTAGPKINIAITRVRTLRQAVNFLHYAPIKGRTASPLARVNVLKSSPGHILLTIITVLLR